MAVVSEICSIVTSDETTQPSVKKFARPISLVFETRDGKTTIIEAETLNGLKNVMRRLQDGEIFCRDGYSLELQLWGHLAEHCGFMRSAHQTDGVQPLGSGIAELTDDFSTLFGSKEEAIAAINISKSLVTKSTEQASKEAPKHLKPDGVNLTPVGEQKLAEILGEDAPICREQDNAVTLYLETPAEEVDVVAESKAADEAFEGRTISGPEAEEIGRRVEEVGEGKVISENQPASE